MRAKIFVALSLLLINCCLLSQTSHLKNFISPKPWITWYWPGNSVTINEVEHQLKMFKNSGFGGIQIIPATGIKGFEGQYIESFSKKWIDIYNNAHHIADSLNMGIGISIDEIFSTYSPSIARKLKVIRIDSLNKDSTLRKNIQLLIPSENNLEAVYAISSDKRNKIDLTWVLDKPDYAGYFSDSTGWNIYGIFSSNLNNSSTPDFLNKNTISSILHHSLDELPIDTSNNQVITINQFHINGLNWSDDFYFQFNALKNYDLKTYLYVFIDEFETDIRSRIYSDYYDVLSQLYQQNLFQELNRYAEGKSSYCQVNTFGYPGDIINFFSSVNMPGILDTKDLQSSTNDPVLQIKNKLTLKFASSSANTSGSNFTNAFIGPLKKTNHFTTHCSELIDQINWLFANGVNNAILNGCTYSPLSEPWPGWMMDESVYIGPNSHIWYDLPELNKYITNCQNLLQNSKADNDIILYFPIYDLWSNPKNNLELYYADQENVNEWLINSEFGKIAEELLKSGYLFDYISDYQLNELTVRRNKLIAGNNEYKLLLIPKCNNIPLKTLNKIMELAENGCRIIFYQGLPKDVPGFYKYESDRLKLLDLKYSLFINKNISVIRSFNEIPPELVKPEESFTKGLNMVRKQSRNGRIYFIYNSSDNLFEDWISLNFMSENSWIYDPLSERKGLAQKDAEGNILLQLYPGQSCFILPAQFTKNTKNPEPWKYLHSTGQAYTIKGEWKIYFVKGFPTSPDTLLSHNLISWSDCINDEIKYYSGIAKYTIRFDLPPEFKEYKDFIIDLGNVQQTAEVYLNGNSLGKILSAPYQLIIPPDNIQKKDNLCEIFITNLSINRIIKMQEDGIEWQPEFNHPKKVTNNDDSLKLPIELYQSGLLGDVKIIPIIK